MSHLSSSPSLYYPPAWSLHISCWTAMCNYLFLSLKKTEKRTPALSGHKLLQLLRTGCWASPVLSPYSQEMKHSPTVKRMCPEITQLWFQPWSLNRRDEFTQLTEHLYVPRPPSSKVSQCLGQACVESEFIYSARNKVGRIRSISETHYL